jgi:DNA-binding NtrC family response regulator
MARILLVDNEIEIIEGRSKIIRNLGYDCLTAKSGNEAIKMIKQDHPDIILTDIKMPDGDGFAVLNAAKELDPDIPVIVFTGHGSIDSAVEAMKLGAFDYIQKPVTKEIIQVILKKAIEFYSLKEENLQLKKQFKKKYQLADMVHKSSVMEGIAQRVMKAAGCDANVLVHGETGTGKEMIARNIHLKSNRKDKPFIPIDCVSLPANLMESELFGFEKGAFTSAIKTKPGLMEIANGGTIFFDEITELDYNLQAKLLRAIQEHEFRRVGGTELINVDIRVISATNHNPEKAVKEKILRKDLYYRLNVIPISMPPLRDRKDDIRLLVHHFIEEFNPSISNEIKGVSKDAMQCLIKYNWPGNVRELKNVIEQAMSMADQNMITLTDLPDNIKKYDMSQVDDFFQDTSFQEAKEKCLNEFYKKYVGYLLKKYDGNITKVARECGLSRWTIYRIINGLDL